MDSSNERKRFGHKQVSWVISKLCSIVFAVNRCSASLMVSCVFRQRQSVCVVAFVERPCSQCNDGERQQREPRKALIGRKRRQGQQSELRVCIRKDYLLDQFSNYMYRFLLQLEYTKLHFVFSTTSPKPRSISQMGIYQP